MQNVHERTAEDLTLSLLFEAALGIIVKGSRAIGLIGSYGLNINRANLVEEINRIQDERLDPYRFPYSSGHILMFFQSLLPEWRAEMKELRVHLTNTEQPDKTPYDLYCKLVGRPSKEEDEIIEFLGRGYREDAILFGKVVKGIFGEFLSKQLPQAEEPRTKSLVANWIEKVISYVAKPAAELKTAEVFANEKRTGKKVVAPVSYDCNLSKSE